MSRSWLLLVPVAATALLWTGSAFSQGRGGGFGRGQQGGIIALVANEAVQKELNLSDDDKAKLKTLGEDFRKDADAERSAAGLPNFADLQNLPDEERQKKMHEMMTKGTEIAKKLGDKYKPKLKEALKPEQYERLQQISYQAAGSAAFSDADVVKALDLSKEQQEKIASIDKAYGEKQRALFTGGGGGGGGREAFTKLNDEKTAELSKVLSAEQNEKFSKLKGKTFDVAQLRQFGPGGPGGRPGRPGAGDKKKAE